MHLHPFYVPIYILFYERTDNIYSNEWALAGHECQHHFKPQREEIMLTGSEVKDNCIS